MLNVSELRKTFPSRGRKPVVAVAGISFSVQSGQVYGLLGPNGAGKTTTLRILATLADADSGSITIGTFERFADPLGTRELLAYVPAEAGLPERLTPREVVQLFARVQGIQNAAQRTEEQLRELGALEYADVPCGNLSTGMRRRVVLARALLHRPQLLLLDEPTDGLDVAGRRDVLTLVRKLADNGCAIVLSSHIMSEVEKVADRIGIMARGAIVAEGTLDEIVQQSEASTLDDAFLNLTTLQPET